MENRKSGSGNRHTLLEDVDLVQPYAKAALAGEPAVKTPEITAALKRLEPFFKHS
jgi:hypothetical protein